MRDIALTARRRPQKWPPRRTLAAVTLASAALWTLILWALL